MIRRIILCEGPDDLAALRELALFIFRAERVQQALAAGAAGDDRSAMLRAGRAMIKITVSRGGKSALPNAAAVLLAAEPARSGAPGDEKLKRLAVLFDPDEAPEASFHQDLQAALAAQAPAWQLTEVAQGAWLARRDPGERVQLRAVAWRGPGPVVDGLQDLQNLERLLCAIAARAYPAEAALIERWLGEIGAARGKPPGWKAALHLWCAVVDEKASELNAAARFLHQLKECRPLVRPVLDEVSLLRALRPLLAPP